jgi:hypothetical protein
MGIFFNAGKGQNSTSNNILENTKQSVDKKHF